LTSSLRLLWGFVFIQCLCAVAVVANLIVSILGHNGAESDWRIREALEISAAVGLLIGTVVGIRAVMLAHRNQKHAESVLRAASGAFATAVDERFKQAKLTRAEHAVAWLVVKGFTIKEAAELRGTSEGTIKSQCNAIYRKLEVSGRAQLLSLLVEDILLGHDAPE